MEKEYVLITGSSSGMGEQIAVDLSLQYNIILNGRDNERLTNVGKKCHEGNHLIWNYDLSNANDLELSVQNLLKENGINVTYFVHCAGFMKQYPIKIVNHSIFAESFNVNIVSAALITKILSSKKCNNKALKSAVFISSNISNFGAKAFSVYGATKAGLDGLMRSLAVELAPEVRINSVLPGGVRTRMTEHMYQDNELINRMAATYPLGLGDVSEISDVVQFLLSDKARWITGQQITVDGGRTINITG
jgi:NAD(P)-dependent dehydrogenase (short-subunit alcohol dehydrogenase family)